MPNPIPLLPCPWCGSEDVERIHHEVKADQWVTIECADCGAAGPAFEWNDEGLMEAIAAWNKGPYADRLHIHADALKAHAAELQSKAAEHLAKADELLKKLEASHATENAIVRAHAGHYPPQEGNS